MKETQKKTDRQTDIQRHQETERIKTERHFVERNLSKGACIA